MYFDKRNGRVLLRDGRYVQSPFEYARAIVEKRRDDDAMVLASIDSDKYEFIKGKTISSDIEDVQIHPKQEPQSDDMIQSLIDIISSMPRYKDEYDERLAVELDFFIRSGNIGFLLKLHELINKFKEDGVVWGVGRGSGSASLTLFVLEVHDVDPVLYNIPFSEMSKEIGEID